MTDTITCTRYGSPCTMTLKACRARWELAKSDRYSELYLDPCLSCPVHAPPEPRAKRGGWKKKLQGTKLSRSLEKLGYAGIKDALQELYVNQRLSTIEIEGITGIRRGSIAYHLAQHGIPARGRGERKTYRVKKS